MLTPQEIQEMDSLTGLKTATPAVPSAVQSRLDELDTLKIPEAPAQTGVTGFAAGMGKGVLSTIKGAGQLGEKIGNLILPKDMEISNYSEEALQKNAREGGFSGTLLRKENLTPKSTAEKIGKGVEQIGEYVLPGNAVSKVAKGANAITRIGAKALTSAGVASMQEGKVGKDAAIAAGFEVGLPILSAVSKPVFNMVGRLFKGLGAGTAGTSTKIIDQIVKNPQTAEQEVQKFITKGGDKVLEENANKIINGVSKIKQEARTAYGAGLETLKATDINPKTFRGGVQSLFDDYGAVVKGNTRELNNVEFRDIANLKRASSVFDKISNTNLNGKSLRGTIESIEKMRYPNPKTEEGMAFNSFIGDVTARLKNTINESTDKLASMNKDYHTDMDIAQSIEDIFGKVKFKNASEVNKVAQKLESLFEKKGLSPSYIDGFLKRAGINPEEFKTSEAIRQISSKTTGANTKGLSLSEGIQQTTSAIVTPELVRDIAIKIGKAEGTVKTVLDNLAPAAKGALIELFTGK